MNRQRGSILIAFALFLAGLVAMIALAIDLGVLESSKLKQQTLADTLALAALETFISTVPAPYLTEDEKFQERANAALTRIRRLAALQGNFLLGESTSATRLPGSANLSFSLNTPAPADSGAVSFGTYFASEPSLPPPGYNCGIGAAFRPCFVPRQTGLPGNANAAQLRLTLPAGGLIRPIFSSLMGFQSFVVSSFSTAAFSSRRIIFALDLSGSMDDDSHPISAAYPPGIIPRSSLRVIHNPPSSIGCNSDFEAIRPGFGQYTFVASGQEDYWNALSNHRPPTASEPHYKNDYRCFRVAVEDNGGTEIQHYLIDVTTAAEPLRSALLAVNSVLNVMLSQGIAGDRVAVIGFDHDILSERTLPHFDALAANIPAGTHMLAATTSDSDFQRLLEISSDPAQTIANPTLLRRRIQENLLFQRYDYRHRSALSVSFNPPTAYTDIPFTIGKSLELFRVSNEGFESNDHLVLVGDGLTNCRHQNLDPTSNNYDLTTAGCGGSFSFFGPSLSKTANYLPLLQSSKVSLNVVQTGALTRPHSLLYKSNLDPNICMDEQEARSAVPSLPFVDATNWGPGGIDVTYTCYPNPTGQGPYCAGSFFAPAQLFSLVNQTNGIWAPVRAPCSTAGPGSCAENTMNFLNSSCAAAAITIPPTPLDIGNSSYTDSRGRLLCDPTCRAPSVQISDAFQQLVRFNPMILVPAPLIP